MITQINLLIKVSANNTNKKIAKAKRTFIKTEQNITLVINQ